MPYIPKKTADTICGKECAAMANEKNRDNSGATDVKNVKVVNEKDARNAPKAKNKAENTAKNKANNCK